ncbi:MAG: hypothetical protein RL007_2676 [Bacteroidota bacterium]
MKHFLAAIFLIGSSFSLSAQSFSVTTTQVNFAGSAVSTDIPSPFWTPVIHNTSGDTLTLRWNRVEQNIPAWWRSSICTEYYCYSMPDDSATWTLLPGDSDMIYVHIYPYGYSDTGNVVVRLHNVENPSDSVRVTFNCNVPVGIEETSVLSEFRLNYQTMNLSFSSTESATYFLSDISGRTQQIGNVTPGYAMSVTVSTHGVYLLTLVTEDGRKSVRRFVL